MSTIRLNYHYFRLLAYKENVDKSLMLRTNYLIRVMRINDKGDIDKYKSLGSSLPVAGGLGLGLENEIFVGAQFWSKLSQNDMDMVEKYM